MSRCTISGRAGLEIYICNPTIVGILTPPAWCWIYDFGLGKFICQLNCPFPSVTAGSQEYNICFLSHECLCEITICCFFLLSSPTWGLNLEPIACRACDLQPLSSAPSPCELPHWRTAWNSQNKQSASGKRRFYTRNRGEQLWPFRRPGLQLLSVLAVTAHGENNGNCCPAIQKVPELSAFEAVAQN